MWICKSCGAINIQPKVSFYFVQREVTVEYFPCSCGREVDGVSGLIMFSVSVSYQEFGTLDVVGCNFLSFGEKEEIYHEETPIMFEAVYCKSCFDLADPFSSTIKTERFETCGEFGLSCWICEENITDFIITNPARRCSRILPA